jgi:16S rRNA (uracil1498-N3)-methyltransferase
MALYSTFPRLYVAAPLGLKSSITLEPEQSHYLVHVMRLNAGDEVRLFNGADGEWRATLGAVQKRSALLVCQERLRSQETGPDIWLCCAPIKRVHFENIIMKATELGVACIQPILTGRTQIRDVNHDRLRTIAIEAAEQSERLNIPDLLPPIAFDKLVAAWPAGRRPLVCAEFGDAQPLQKALASLIPSPAAIVTGPEGGFLPEELDRLRGLKDALMLRLGPRVLRADTAALAALACWQATCGDWR